jgi:O6-methylguanine-DNA--protein-cysteine methyltransferase
MNEFKDKVFNVVKQIRKGETMSYKQVAQAMIKIKRSH